MLHYVSFLVSAICLLLLLSHYLLFFVIKFSNFKKKMVCFITRSEASLILVFVTISVMKLKPEITVMSLIIDRLLLLFCRTM